MNFFYLEHLFFSCYFLYFWKQYTFFKTNVLFYNLKKGWALITAPAITANWEAETDQQWTVPIGMGVSKITMVGKQALSLSLQYYHNAIRPDNIGGDLVRMQVTFLFPK